ncbi:MAG: tetraacyldisaccharide 4'-kinase [Humidesulfovibrio sp.]|uniref:tetraacyldisaccharide 4'-kinase n=1 Tax=Humidesulfovibrio sp. TaxID=2910988 RepID=UPI0027E90462|nr:tetraacyldisaccharide 4'-kinase [Humidesulfovibrio sp.]MDQ7836109.1 tetraacyldisaccharide 4'-kinase [Humidesulfovibrio sp.]
MPNIPQLQRALRPLLLPLGVLYAQVMRLRRWLYGRGALSSWRPPCVCVSVGNIGWGGSGKTPLCGHILRWAGKHEEHGVVLTRGYRAKPKRLPLLVTPGADPAQAGDEPLLLAKTHRLARVVVDPKRRRGGAWACERFDPDFVLLDDGFQHLPVARDIDLVLLTPFDLLEGWGRVCPLGTWREGASALDRATAFLIKVVPGKQPGLAEAIETRLKPKGKPVFTFALKPKGLARLDGSARARDLGSEGYVIATGIADPAQVAATAAILLGAEPRQVMAFADHQAFTQADVAKIREAAQAENGAHVVVTPKDAVKLRLLDGTGGFWTLRTEVRFGPKYNSDAEFDDWFAARFDELSEPHRQAYREAMRKKLA